MKVPLANWLIPPIFTQSILLFVIQLLCAEPEILKILLWMIDTVAVFVMVHLRDYMNMHRFSLFLICVLNIDILQLRNNINT